MKHQISEILRRPAMRGLLRMTIKKVTTFLVAIGIGPPQNNTQADRETHPTPLVILGVAKNLKALMMEQRPEILGRRRG